ncbi:SMP-30/gluconolactonase/LRE family protein [Actinoplanes sp. NPDC049265]|uniref:SMP-30/gluconolactonase/LRE family protein n=1 Tax=Actinoplanes sp. NPDC049265 TaxID=3363902 RepID=UPI0037192243
MVERWVATRASDRKFRLAEGPIWDGPRALVHWVEIEAGALHSGRLTDSGVELTETRELDRMVTAVARGRTGDLLVAGLETLLVVTADGEVTPGPRILPEGSGRRLNDGKCDPDGAFLVGTMQLNEQPGTDEVLVRVGADRSVTTVESGAGLSNGLAWSPDGSLRYWVDTVPGVIHRRSSTSSEVFLRDDWDPDGICADADGNVWVAVYGTGEVRRFSPAGDLTGVVAVASAEVTCPAFVGPGLDRLMITARDAVYLADVGATGLPAYEWAGFH